jgi:hypothetical protein
MSINNKPLHIYHHFNRDKHYHYYPNTNIKSYRQYKDGSNIYNNVIYTQHFTRHHRNLWTSSYYNNDTLISEHEIFHVHYHYHYHTHENQNINQNQNHDYGEIFYSKDFKPFWYKKNAIHTNTNNNLDTNNNLETIPYPNNFKLGVFTEHIEKQYERLYNINNYCGTSSSNKNYTFDSKHHKIDCFFNIWNIYKMFSAEANKTLMLNNILPHFTNINWMTVSRLYNPNDIEFVKLYNSRLDFKFAKQYNPLLKNQTFTL